MAYFYLGDLLGRQLKKEFKLRSPILPENNKLEEEIEE